MIGTLEISGSEATSLKNSRISVFASSRPSSKQISIIFAPLLTWSLAILRASSRSLFLISFANFGEPITLVLSPTIVNGFFRTLFILKGSKSTKECIIICCCNFSWRERRNSFDHGSNVTWRRPQQPPIRLINPDSANS